MLCFDTLQAMKVGGVLLSYLLLWQWQPCSLRSAAVGKGWLSCPEPPFAAESHLRNWAWESCHCSLCSRTVVVKTSSDLYDTLHFPLSVCKGKRQKGHCNASLLFRVWFIKWSVALHLHMSQHWCCCVDLLSIHSCVLYLGRPLSFASDFLLMLRDKVWYQFLRGFLVTQHKLPVKIKCF